MAAYRPKTVDELLGTGDSIVSGLFAVAKGYSSLMNTLSVMDYRQEKKMTDAEDYTIEVLDDIIEGIRLPENKNSRVALKPFIQDLKRIYESGVGSVSTVNKFNQVTRHLNRGVDRATLLEGFHKAQRDMTSINGSASIEKYIELGRTHGIKAPVSAFTQEIKDDYDTFETRIRKEGWWGTEEQNMKEEIHGKLAVINSLAGQSDFIEPNQAGEIERLWDQYLADGKAPSLNKEYDDKIMEAQYYGKQIADLEAKVLLGEQELAEWGSIEKKDTPAYQKKDSLLKSWKRVTIPQLKIHHKRVNDQILNNDLYLAYDWKGNQRAADAIVTSSDEGFEEGKLSAWDFFDNIDKTSQKTEDEPAADNDLGGSDAVPDEPITDPKKIEANRLQALELERRANQREHGGDKTWFKTNEEVIERIEKEQRQQEENTQAAKEQKLLDISNYQKASGWMADDLKRIRYNEDGKNPKKIPDGIANIKEVDIIIQGKDIKQYHHTDGKPATKKEVDKYEAWEEDAFLELTHLQNKELTRKKERIRKGKEDEIAQYRMDALYKDLKAFEDLHRKVIKNQYIGYQFIK